MFVKTVLTLVLLLLINGCSTRLGKTSKPKYHSEVLSTSKNYSHPTMKPYKVNGKTYYPTVVSVGETFKGRASWYGPNFHGKLTSNGEVYNMHQMTAAHKTLPMNTVVKVTNLENGKTATVRINDRGPFVGTRIIDLSNAAAKKIGMVGKGTAMVKLEVLGFQEKGGSKIASAKELRRGPSEMVGGNYAVQVASFSNIEGAIKTQEKLDGFQGYESIIKDTTYNSKPLYRVWLRGFRSEDEARDFAHGSYFEHDFIVREN